MSSHLLTVKNIKLSLFIDKSIRIDSERFLIRRRQRKRPDFFYTLYGHGSPATARFINLTGLTTLKGQLWLVHRFLWKRFRVKILGFRIDNIMLSRKTSDWKLNFDLNKVKETGQKLYGDRYFFFYEPDLCPAAQMQPKKRHSGPTFMLNHTGSCVIFRVKDTSEISDCQAIVDSLYTRENLSSV